MNKIQRLSSNVYNKIAAGEVVERPASVVKELVENSIDAGATNIEINIINSGLTSIEIIDNGCGIAKDDIFTSFEKHATSKIFDESDLTHIHTLGFRGEALSSISSVSEVTIKSKLAENHFGYTGKFIEGFCNKIEEQGMPNGTSLKVEKLFANVPARLKFLKKPKSEEEEITNIVSRFILSNPSIGFKYTIDGKNKFLFNGSGLENAIYAVYGSDLSANLIHISSGNMSDITLDGYIATPQMAKNNRSYQTLILNGRYIINSTVSSAVSKGFDDYIMKGKYPFFILNLNMPFSDVDINVHPRKMEAKFLDNSKIFSLVYYAVNNALLSYKKAENTAMFESMAKTEVSNLSNINDKVYVNTASFNVNNTSNLSNPEYSQTTNGNDLILNQGNNFKNLKMEDLSFLSSLNNATFKNNTEVNSNNNQANLEIFKDSNTENNQNKASFFKIIGRVFNTYTIVEDNDKLLFIDEHACHERLLYDDLCNNLNANTLAVQQLLLPYILNVNYVENEVLTNILGYLKETGFEIETFGDLCYKISAIPMILKDIDLNAFFQKLLSEKNQYLQNIKNSDLIKDKLKQQACKAAVKSGFNLNSSEVDALLNKINEKNMVLLCPHGRPAIIAYTRNDIDKWFKRIL